jgi:hypothetical protein
MTPENGTRSMPEAHFGSGSLDDSFLYGIKKAVILRA